MEGDAQPREGREREAPVISDSGNEAGAAVRADGDAAEGTDQRAVVREGRVGDARKATMPSSRKARGGGGRGGRGAIAAPSAAA
jgi:hypothetical protein